jgi:DNA-binding response OmpR family regulator
VPAADPATPIAAGADPRSRPRLVIAEDHAEMADVLLTYLDAAGYEVHLARDGISAASLIERVHPSLVVLDANMPGLSGWTILERLKGPGSPQPAPQVVMLTGDDAFPPVSSLADVVLRKPAALRKIAAVLAERLKPEPPSPPIAA